MNFYTVDLYFVGEDLDDALSTLPFLDLDSAETYRDDFANKYKLHIYETEITFDLSTSDLKKIHE